MVVVRKVIIVSVHILYVSFTPVYVGQEGLSGNQVYIRLHQFTSVGRDVELDNTFTWSPDAFYPAPFSESMSLNTFKV